MKNKALAIILCVVLAVCLSVTLTSCDKDDAKPTSIVYLGDSIAEAVAGPSPIQDRVNYGYYGILGQINDYKYDNRSVSGYQTKNLLDYISRVQCDECGLIYSSVGNDVCPDSDCASSSRHDYEDANTTLGLISNADIIHISILGNDLLQYDFTMMMADLAAELKYGDDWRTNAAYAPSYTSSTYPADTTFVGADGNAITRAKDTNKVKGDGYDLFSTCLSRAAVNISKIVDRLLTLNPDATIIFQNVYNPVDGEAELVTDQLRSDLEGIDVKYDMTTADGVAEVRSIGKLMIGSLDNTLNTYLDAHTDKKSQIHIVDALTAFDNIYKANMQRGMDLIAGDGVHPSNEGHAVLAQLNEDLLVTLGKADAADGLKQYKDLRSAQIDRLYDGTKKGEATFDTASVKAKLAAATNMDKVTEVYFDETSGYICNLFADTTTNKMTNGNYYSADTFYTLTGLTMNNLAQTAETNASTNALMGLVIPILTKDGKTGVTFGKDGKFTVSVNANIGDLLGLVSTMGISLGINGMDMSGKAMGNLDLIDLIEVYVYNMFPGVSVVDVDETIGLVTESMGIDIDGAEELFGTAYTYTDSTGVEPLSTTSFDSYIDFLFAYALEYKRLPRDIETILASLGEITISVTSVYSRETVYGADGTAYDAIYVGQYFDNASPWFIMTEYTAKDEDTKKDVAHVKGSLEILGITLTF